MKFELKLQRRVIYFISNLTPEDKAQLVHSIEALRLDPYVDNITKFVLPYPPAVFNLYQDGRFCIIYRLTGNDVVDFLMAGYAPYVPPIHEWDDWRKK